MDDAADRPGDGPEGREVLFVDLDGSLVATDLFSEHLFVLLGRRPWCAAMLPGWLLRGRSGLKDEVARRVAVDPAALPYNEALLGLLQGRKASGTLLVLATAAPRPWAEAVADHLGLFDAVLATDPGRNLKGRGKLRAIRDFCRDRGLGAFSYVGDAAADLPIWQEAAAAFVVAPDDRLLRRLRALEPAVAVCPVGAPRRPLRAAARALRPARWARNALVFAPLVVAGRADEPRAVAAAAAAFASFCLASSAVAVVDDLADLAADRAHPSRRRRPFASGQLPPTWGPPMAVALLAASLLTAALALPVAALATPAAFAAIALADALVIRGRTWADVLMPAGLDLLRVVAGAAAVGVAVPGPLAAVVAALSLALATVRRLAGRAPAPG